MSDITISAKLKPGVSFTGKIKTNTDSSPIIDQNSGIVTWKLSNLSAGRGIVSDPAEAIIQLEYTPSTLDEGRDVMLVESSTAEAKDLFTGLMLTSRGDMVDTSLRRDTMIQASSRGVQE